MKKFAPFHEKNILSSKRVWQCEKKRLKKQGDFKNDFNICIKIWGFVLELAQQGFKKKALLGN
jgi:hypothetical protein